MKFHFTAQIARPVPVSKRYPLGFEFYGFLDAVATSEDEARSLIEAHLAAGKPLGYSEAEIRRANPKRTPAVRGLFVHHFWPPRRVPDDRPSGVVALDGRPIDAVLAGDNGSADTPSRSQQP